MKETEILRTGTVVHLALRTLTTREQRYAMANRPPRDQPVSAGPRRAAPAPTPLEVPCIGSRSPTAQRHSPSRHERAGRQRKRFMPTSAPRTNGSAARAWDTCSSI